MLDVARWTPLYGYVTLARYPVTEGVLLSNDGATTTEPLWIAVANVTLWSLLLATVATSLVHRGRSRQ